MHTLSSRVERESAYTLSSGVGDCTLSHPRMKGRRGHVLSSSVGNRGYIISSEVRGLTSHALLQGECISFHPVLKEECTSSHPVLKEECSSSHPRTGGRGCSVLYTSHPETDIENILLIQKKE